VYYYLCLLVNSLGVLGVGCKSGRSGVSEGAALLQPLCCRTLLYHYQFTLYNYLVDFGGCEESLRPVSEVCAVLANVTNQEPLDYPGAPVDLSEALLNVLLVGLNVVG
jgi:hypothetical protein